MKLLITGSNGQLGNELVNIIVCKRAEIGTISPAYRDCEITAVDIDDMDITDLGSVRKVISSVKPDAVINCAAMTNVNGCESDYETAMKVNAIGPRNIAVACEEIGAKLVQVSTDYVFSGDADRPYCEWDIVAPCGIYGKSKALGEKYASEHCSRTFIVRTAWLYGYVGKNFVKTIISAARKNGTVKVVNDQFGNPTSANDLAYHILKLILTEEYGIYHCTGNGVCSWYDLAKRVIERSGTDAEVLPCTTDEYPTPAKRPAYSALNNLMLSCTVGDEMRDWKDAADNYVDNLIRSGF